MNNQSDWITRSDILNEHIIGPMGAVMAMYDWSDINEDVRSHFKRYVYMELSQYEPSSLNVELWSITQLIALNTYDVLGLVPATMRAAMPQWLDYACKWGHDSLAFRLLNDGVDPDARAPRRWSAATRIRKNRETMPKSWVWLCRRELEKKAAKARKRSWASGALVEPRAL